MGVCCLGGAVVDRKYLLHAASVRGTSNPAAGSTSAGGVARNVAENLARLGIDTALVSVVGDDLAGRGLVADLERAGVDVLGVRTVLAAATAEYLAVLEPSGELALGVASMAVLDDLGPGDVDRALGAAPAWLFADCNLRPELLAGLVARAAGLGVRLAVDAVSTPKVIRLPADLTGVDLLFCNAAEATAWATRHAGGDCGSSTSPSALALAGRLRSAGAAAVVLTRGAAPVLLATAAGVQEYPVPPATVRDVTGAGDALVAGTLAGLATGEVLSAAVQRGLRLAAAVLASPDSVAP